MESAYVFKSDCLIKVDLLDMSSGKVLRSLVKQAQDVIESDIKYILANFTAVVLEVIRFLGLKYVIASM